MRQGKEVPPKEPAWRISNFPGSLAGQRSRRSAASLPAPWWPAAPTQPSPHHPDPPSDVRRCGSAGNPRPCARTPSQPRCPSSLDNGLVKMTFGRDDVGVKTGWGDVSITATSVVVAGTELAHNLNGVDP